MTQFDPNVLACVSLCFFFRACAGLLKLNEARFKKCASIFFKGEFMTHLSLEVSQESLFLLKEKEEGKFSNHDSRDDAANMAIPQSQNNQNFPLL